jgi:hypothetical protein
MLGDDDSANTRQARRNTQFVQREKVLQMDAVGLQFTQACRQGKADPISSKNVSGWNLQIERFDGVIAASLQQRTWRTVNRRAKDLRPQFD